MANAIPTQKPNKDTGLEDVNISGSTITRDKPVADHAPKQRPADSGVTIIEKPLNPGLNTSNDK